MSDNGESLFRADKANRNASFSFPNNSTVDAVTAGDQSAQVHPVPRVIPATEQKVNATSSEPAAAATPAEQNAGRY